MRLPEDHKRVYHNEGVYTYNFYCRRARARRIAQALYSSIRASHCPLSIGFLYDNVNL